MRYFGNPKHKEPWQPGRKGSLCPSRRKMPDLDPQKLLESSELCGAKRYAVFEGLAFAALPNGGNVEERCSFISDENVTKEQQPNPI